jgi:hypothetical protein
MRGPIQVIDHLNVRYQVVERLSLLDMALKATRGSIQEKNHINVLKKNVIKPLKHQEIYKNMYEHIQVTKAFKTYTLIKNSSATEFNHFIS